MLKLRLSLRDVMNGLFIPLAALFHGKVHVGDGNALTNFIINLFEKMFFVVRG